MFVEYIISTKGVVNSRFFSTSLLNCCFELTQSRKKDAHFSGFQSRFKLIKEDNSAAILFSWKVRSVGGFFIYLSLALFVVVRKIQQTFEISLGFFVQYGRREINWPETTRFWNKNLQLSADIVVGTFNFGNSTSSHITEYGNKRNIWKCVPHLQHVTWFQKSVMKKKCLRYFTVTSLFSSSFLFFSFLFFAYKVANLTMKNNTTSVFQSFSQLVQYTILFLPISKPITCTI